MSTHSSTGPAAEPDPCAIATLNDRLRANLAAPDHDRVMMTAGVAALIGDTNLFAGFHRQAELLRAVRDFCAFSPANDPHHEHDMGQFDFSDTPCLWKIDYYDETLSGGSPDPADGAATVRVLTIMRSDEW